MPRQHATDAMPDEPGMEPDEAKFRVNQPAPDEPGAEEAEGHGMKGKFAKEPAPDEPGGDMNPDGAIKVRG